MRAAFSSLFPTLLGRFAALLALCLTFFFTPAQAQQNVQPTVAAASDLKFALEEVAQQFEKAGGPRLRLIFGSSGHFYSQILQGAPFHMFMSADEEFVFKLADAGKTQDRGLLYAYGRIGLMTPKRSPLKADGEFKDLAQALRDGRLTKFAIASPAHAPYGMRAKEALQHAGLWPQIEGKLVFGENVSQAAQFVSSGAADGGIVASSLAAPLASTTDFALIPASWHKPLAQRMVLLRQAPASVRDFYQYLTTPSAQAILVRHGFSTTAPK